VAQKVNDEWETDNNPLCDSNVESGSDEEPSGKKGKKVKGSKSKFTRPGQETRCV